MSTALWAHKNKLFYPAGTSWLPWCRIPLIYLKSLETNLTFQPGSPIAQVSYFKGSHYLGYRASRNAGYSGVYVSR